jgi:DNA-binding IclR family transcriptional regulator
MRAEVLRVFDGAKEALYWEDLVRLVGQDLATIRVVIASLEREGLLASDDGDEPFHLRGRWPEAG